MTVETDKRDRYGRELGKVLAGSKDVNLEQDLKVVTGDDDPEKSPNMIRTVFHPEYGYGDFVAKLLPQTDDGKIEYSSEIAKNLNVATKLRRTLAILRPTIHNSSFMQNSQVKRLNGIPILLDCGYIPSYDLTLNR